MAQAVITVIFVCTLLAFMVWFIRELIKFEKKATRDLIEIWLLIVRLQYNITRWDAALVGNRVLVDQIDRKLERLRSISDKKEFAKEQIKAFNKLSKKLTKRKITEDQMIEEFSKLFASGLPN